MRVQLEESFVSNTVVFPANDGNVVALNMKTGEVKWDKHVLEPTRFRFSGGPLVADGKILLGTSTGSTAYGHNFIVALDANTGEERWRTSTIALPGNPGERTWNNIAVEQRTGAGSWTPGSYDPDTNLAFFGTGNNYFNDRTRSNDDINNDQLYTDSTLALDVDTGKLVWYFQHLPNDRWNYDWAFERLLLDLPIKGKKRKCS